MRWKVAFAYLVLLFLLGLLAFSTGKDKPELSPHQPIYIYGDRNFTSENGVVSGAGTVDDPYMISGWKVKAGNRGYGIKIEGAESFFVIRDCTIKGVEKGIFLSFVRNGKIENCHISDSNTGVYLWYTYRSEIFNNKISKNHHHAIHLLNSDLNLLVENELTLNGQKGISLELSSTNLIRGNQVRENSKGISMWDSSHNKIKRNQVIKNKEYGLKIFESSDNQILGNVMDSNGKLGIFLSNSSHNQMEKNLIKSHQNGIFMAGGLVTSESSNHNTIAANKIEDNAFRGIWLEDLTQGNLIYHNSLVYNGVGACDMGENIWDKGYSSGGNYWGDYRGMDKFSGIDQNQPGSDKIGDESFKIPCGEGVDRFPLMGSID